MTDSLRAVSDPVTRCQISGRPLATVPKPCAYLGVAVKRLCGLPTGRSEPGTVAQASSHHPTQAGQILMTFQPRLSPHGVHRQHCLTMVHAILRRKPRAPADVVVDSAGVSDEEQGNFIDRRAPRVLRDAGTPGLDHRACQICAAELGGT